MSPKRVALLILDGWGISPDPAVSAIAQAKTPFFNGLMQKYVHATLNTTGLCVGLPDRQMGNSEVGHMNLGAGRVVYQELVRIGEAMRTGSFQQEPALTELQSYMDLNPDARLHLMGLVSDGGVHSHIDHLTALIDLFGPKYARRVFIHAFTDGRDCDPRSGKGFVTAIEKRANEKGAALATVIGRYYAMDRDKRWERVKLAYDLLVTGAGEPTASVSDAFDRSYAEGVTDEFIKPLAMIKDGKPVAHLQEGDAVLLFNFRTDRGREITEVLTQREMPEHGMHNLRLHYVTMTRYDEAYRNVRVIFEKDNLANTLGQTLAEAGKRQVRIAETEKYPHVTFFYNGGREEPYAGEERILCPSPKVATYDLQPEMSAFDITDAIIPRLQSKEPDYICLNFANADMVGHTGVFSACIEAVQAVDQCLSRLVPAALENGYTCWIIADHGNSDNEINPDGSPNTQHSTNLVPSLIVDPDFEQGKGCTLKDGKLGDVAPSILTLMGIPIPEAMTGTVLV